MLVIARKAGQVVDIGLGLLQVRIISIRGSVVKVGIEAPGSIEVFRGELLDRLRSEPEENPPVLEGPLPCTPNTRQAFLSPTGGSDG
jgi:carbon storage regulator